MLRRLGALAVALFVPLALAACLFLPGKFESTLTVRADRSFTFAYKGEVHAMDIAGMMTSAMAGMGDDEADKGKQSPEEIAKRDEELRKVAAALEAEAGYRSVEYRGDNLFYVDYEIAGVLTHNYAFPFNTDAAMAFPFVALELRGKDGIRMKAPGFGKGEDDSSGLGGSGADTDLKVDGTFTLVTDAEVVGTPNATATGTGAGGRTFTWRATPQSAIPEAMLKVRGI